MLSHQTQRVAITTRLTPPENRDQLKRWLHINLDLAMPKSALCPGHNSPLDYLARTLFEQPGDIVVWACRGGGKTMLGAVATLLDLLFKPGIQVRILGGSLEQSEKMYRYLRTLLDHNFADLIRGRPTRRRIQLNNGSTVEILAQSERSVRGTRIQKLRCDEVELFNPDVWHAAQLTTRTIDQDDQPIHGAIESLSTMHKLHGTMQSLLTEDSPSTRTVFKWCIWDVIAECHPDRPCATCPLWNDCQGKAKHATGFVPVEDVIEMARRVSRRAWEHEMLCLRPRTHGGVFDAFSRDTHVKPWLLPRQARAGEAVPLAGQTWHAEPLIAGVDFGFRGAFVCLWLQPLRDPAGRLAYWVLDELITQERTLSANADAMRRHGPADNPWRPKRVYCDVAGRAANSHTGRADEAVLRAAGYKVHSSAMPVETGIARIHELIEPALATPSPDDTSSTPLLLVDPRCPRLIEALETLRRLPGGAIEKDNRTDHPIDALRYALINHEKIQWSTHARSY